MIPSITKGDELRKPRDHVQALQELLRAEDLDAYWVPSTDPHASEYVASAWQRRRFLTGFDGSAGLVVVLRDRACLWTDSRYHLQAEQQLEGSGIELFRQGLSDVPEPEAFLCATLPAGCRVGIDTRMISIQAYESLERSLRRAQIALVPQEHDLVERVWGNLRPALPSAPIRIHPDALAGASAEEKLARLQETLKARVDACALTALDEIAWLLNLRGADVDYNPVFIAYLLVDQRGHTLFVDPDKLSDAVRRALPPKTRVLPYEAFEPALQELGGQKLRISLDPRSANERIAALLRDAGGEVVLEPLPIAAWKAVKCKEELEGMRRAHHQDGLALLRFVRWLRRAVPEGREDELSVARKIDALRLKMDDCIGPSFASIVGYGPNGAIVHYQVTEEKALPLRPEGILLVDSGGQYRFGTTDVTRTYALGPARAIERQAYTAVLRGHLALGRALFPQGTDGYQLDVLARAPVWTAGLNYGHGTGHGVGAALCVHEGPFSVSLRKNMTPIEAGHILSIEPGFYQPASETERGFGIRIENLAVVVERCRNECGRFLGFEPLTLCPYERALIEVESLSAEERGQIDRYHAIVREALWPDLDADERRDLEELSRPLA